MPSKHFVWPYEVSWAAPLLFTALAGIFLTLIQTCIPNETLAEWGFTMQKHDIEVDEDLPNFWKVVKMGYADEVVKETDNLKDNYFVEIEDPRVVDLLAGVVDMPKRAVTRTPWYGILNNLVYSEAFYYFGANINEREKLIKPHDEDFEGNVCEQSDIVNILLNLGSIPDEVARRFDFAPGFQEGFKRSMLQYREDFTRRTGV